MPVRLYNFDGLVGPTHNYAGLAFGNLASEQHRHEISSPRAAALEGIAKMRLLASLGTGQAVLPPHERPHIPTLWRLGFAGTDTQVIESAARVDLSLLAACTSASAMWTANAATVSPSAETADGRVHITPANLTSQLHRSIETPTTARILAAIFPSGEHFEHHAALPSVAYLGDEGAANHMRLYGRDDAPGVEIFAYGRQGLDHRQTTRFPARQTLEASAAIARLHGLSPHRTLMVRQNAAAIDAGAFHNDVVAVAERDVFFHHEQAFAEGAFAGQLRQAFSATCGGELQIVTVPSARVSLSDAVASYLFNSQLIPTGPQQMELVAPAECQQVLPVARYLAETTGSGHAIAAAHYIDVRQSMHNGGGPACLRLRVWLNEPQQSAAAPGVFWSERLEADLTAWVGRHYREELKAADLADPKLLQESRAALDELTRLLGIGSVYDFQL